MVKAIPKPIQNNAPITAATMNFVSVLYILSVPTGASFHCPIVKIRVKKITCPEHNSPKHNFDYEPKYEFNNKTHSISFLMPLTPADEELPRKMLSVSTRVDEPLLSANGIRIH